MTRFPYFAAGVLLVSACAASPDVDKTASPALMSAATERQEYSEAEVAAVTDAIRTGTHLEQLLDGKLPVDEADRLEECLAAAAVMETSAVLKKINGVSSDDAGLEDAQRVEEELEQRLQALEPADLSARLERVTGTKGLYFLMWSGDGRRSPQIQVFQRGAQATLNLCKQNKVID